jgi:hypothetical protein
VKNKKIENEKRRQILIWRVIRNNDVLFCFVFLVKKEKEKEGKKQIRPSFPFVLLNCQEIKVFNSLDNVTIAATTTTNEIMTERKYYMIKHKNE